MIKKNTLNKTERLWNSYLIFHYTRCHDFINHSSIFLSWVLLKKQHNMKIRVSSYIYSNTHNFSLALSLTHTRKDALSLLHLNISNFSRSENCLRMHEKKVCVLLTAVFSPQTVALQVVCERWDCSSWL